MQDREIVLIASLVAGLACVLIARAFKPKPPERPSAASILKSRPSPPPPPAKPAQAPPARRPKKTPIPIPKAFNGKVYVVDGDTIKIKRQRIRLYGMDAPEMSQRGGSRSKSHLIAMAGGKMVCVEPIAIDCYGRIVARVWLGKIDLSERMVRDGFAVAMSKYQKDYESAELHARRHKFGLWSAKHRGISDPSAHRRWQRREDRATG